MQSSQYIKSGMHENIWRANISLSKVELRSAPLSPDFGGKETTRWNNLQSRVRDRKEHVISRNRGWLQHYISRGISKAQQYIFRGISKAQHYISTEISRYTTLHKKNIRLYWKYIYIFNIIFLNINKNLHFDDIWFSIFILCMCVRCWLYQQTLFKNLRFFCKNYFISSISQIYFIYEFDKLKTSP